MAGLLPSALSLIPDIDAPNPGDGAKKEPYAWCRAFDSTGNSQVYTVVSLEYE